MSQNNKPHIFVIGNEKGGAGKTTCSMHLIIGLLERGYKVASIDVDVRQSSLSSYLYNRELYNKSNPDKQVLSPIHYHLNEIKNVDIQEKNLLEQKEFESILSEINDKIDYIVIDTPGSYSNLSRIAHSYADIIITPINDSFIDLDVLAKIDGNNLEISKPSIYSQMIWEQKLEKASRGKGASIEWFVLRNRLTNLNAQNKRNVSYALTKLAKRIGFKEIPGFSERVIFRELFLQGLTLLDLTKASYNKKLSISHVAARQEIRNFLDNLISISK